MVKQMPDSTFIQTLEEIASRAMPALINRHYDGWLLRYSMGYTRRANAIYPLYGSSLDVREKIAFCETLYHKQQQPAIFKLTENSQPPDLETQLKDRGYENGAMAHLQTVALGQIQLPTISTFPGSYRLTTTWFKAYTTLNQVPNQHQDTLHQMLMLQQLPTYYAVLHDANGVICAVGLAVQDKEWVGIFDVVVGEPYRRQGYGKRLMHTLLAWGKKQGAHHAYLQVNDANTTAQRLYQQLGFQEAYHYWYRHLAPVTTAV